MSGRSSQAKGRRGEIELAQYLRAHGFPTAQPGAALNYGTQPDITGVDGLHIECKRHEKLEVNKWYTQAVTDSERMKDGAPVVMFRQNRGQWMVVISLSDFIAAMNGGAKNGESAGSK